MDDPASGCTIFEPIARSISIDLESRKWEHPVSADVVPHPGRTGTHPIVRSDCEPTPEPDTPTRRSQEPTIPSLARVLMRGRVTPVQLGIVALLLGGGSGVGGSWLLGPGGWSDDSAVRRSHLAAMRTDLASMRTSLESCEADIALLDDGQVELLENASDTQAKHAKAITTIALKLGIAEQIDVSPPRQRARRVRR